MFRATVLAALSATALATGMSSSSSMYNNGQNMGNMYGSSSSGMMYGGSTTSMMNSAMTTSSSMMMESSTTTTSTFNAVSTNANVASCSNQGLNTGMGDQLVTIVQVSNLNGSALRYSPDNVMAPPGSIVQFQFHPKNHTVSESSFADPCHPLAANLTSPQRPGQKSGFVPVTPTDTDMKVYNLLVNDTKPIWIYCGQVGHCQKGMVMVINQNQTDTVHTLDNFRAAAMQVPLPGAASSAAASAPAASSVTAGGSGANAGVSATGSPTSAASTPGSSTTVGPGPAAQQASGSASGLPAVFTGMAVPRAVPVKLAGLSGLVMAGLSALL